ncbi:transposable element Tcb1 transposase [Trichonephila clavipes]|nr:transposable element Tcb1 transposase [Trichonephila clavipes]
MRIVRMAVVGCAATSRIIAQHIQSFTHHSVSSRTIRRRLQQSGMSTRRPLLRLPLIGNHRRLRRQWCNERKAVFNFIGTLGTSDCYAPPTTISRVPPPPSVFTLPILVREVFSLYSNSFTCFFFFGESFHYPPPTNSQCPGLGTV